MRTKATSETVSTGELARGQCATAVDWQAVDRALRGIAQRRAALDAEEAHWLREAEALQIWRPLGMVSALDYMERVMGYAPRTAHDRLRVARALGALPKLTAALGQGELAFSAVRELTRVATAATEDEWLAHATGKNLRQIEELVADHHLGDRPDDPKDPQARVHVVRLELSAPTFALLRQARRVLDDERQARRVLDDEHGTSLSEDQLVEQLCHAVLDGAPTSEATGRAKFQVAVTVCERCRQGWQEGAGARIAIDAAAVERALCDAQHIGSLDGDVPERAHQDISPSVARFVWRRDGGRCRVPGCRSSRGLELHHLVHREHGGTHDAGNIVLCCSGCHMAHHAGTLTINGTAERLVVTRPARASSDSSDLHVDAFAEDDEHLRLDGTALVELANSDAHVGTPARLATEPANAGAHVCAATSLATEPANPGAHVGTPTKLDLAEMCAEAKAALKQMGWKPAVAQGAVRQAAVRLGATATLERMIVEALRRCPRPPSAMPAPDARAVQM